MTALRKFTNKESRSMCSPFQMLYAKEMNVVFDISVKPVDGMGKTAKAHMETLIYRLKIVKDRDKNKVETAQDKMKNRYD